MTWLRLAIYALATWRLATLFSSDLGPWAVFQKLRSFLKREAKTNKPLRDSKVHLGVTCILCESVWHGALISAYVLLRYYLPTWAVATCEAGLLALALSALAILIGRALPPK